MSNFANLRLIGESKRVNLLVRGQCVYPGQVHYSNTTFRQKYSILRKCSSNNLFHSFDNEDDLDEDTARELQQRVDPQYVSKGKKRLEQLWTIQYKAGLLQSCGCCGGCGQQECQWCHGTGILMVGDKLVCDVYGGNDCKICKGQGYVNCEHCRGTGRVAGWLEPGCELDA
eukprot:TRINITY_DN32382_c0_g1_i1.p3 TRINITY_DN32382_c0_g1~~TRINITY_DN32382_c0_g1_i1.p3  ORF type:complete len:171 (+),score=11.03 TRINITY_DN32382_c0_g1_i1:33-545(+)